MSHIVYHLLSRHGRLSGIAGFLEVSRSQSTVRGLLMAIGPLPRECDISNLEELSTLRARFVSAYDESSSWETMLMYLAAGRRVRLEHTVP